MAVQVDVVEAAQEMLDENIEHVQQRVAHFPQGHALQLKDGFCIQCRAVGYALPCCAGRFCVKCEAEDMCEANTEGLCCACCTEVHAEHCANKACNRAPLRGNYCTGYCDADCEKGYPPRYTGY